MTHMYLTWRHGYEGVCVSIFDLSIVTVYILFCCWGSRKEACIQYMDLLATMMYVETIFDGAHYSRDHRSIP